MPLSNRIAKDNKYFPWFEDYLGALDRTHIPIKVPTEDQIRYRNRKGSLMQNILIVCDFDIRFLYILAGWEGSAHNGRVLKDAQNLKGFTTPKGKYWLGDAGYGYTEFILAPYRGIRYYLKEFEIIGLRLRNTKELFNLRYTTLYNIIEYIFNITKKKFKILASIIEYDLATLAQLIIALYRLANFLTAYSEIIEQELAKVDMDLLYI
jgi:hypothetical protein